MSERVAVITGAARGIGKAISERLLREGFKLIAIDMLKDDLDNLSSQYGDSVYPVLCDITNFDEINRIAEELSDNFRQIDVLINNAGITRDGLFMRMSLDNWEKVISVNLTGAFNVTRAFIRNILRSREMGRIINISSVVGVQGNAGQVNYSSSKAGLLGMTKSLAREFGGKGITVNAVAPGYIITEMTKDLSEEVKKAYLDSIPLKRGGTPEDIANVIAFLVSEDASYITGQVIHVDGGMITA
mgnify:CR=1 FL=1